MSNPIYIDGNYTVPQPEGEPRLKAPFPGVATQYVLEQDFIQYGPYYIGGSGGFVPGVLNTVWGHDFTSLNTFAGFFLVAESALEDIGGGLVKWTRTYASKPVERYDSASLTYMYPGLNVKYTVGASTFVVTTRLPIAKAADVRIVYDYFLIGTAGTGLATPDYADFIDIPPITHQRWGFVAYNGAVPIGLIESTPPVLWDEVTYQGQNYSTVPSASAYLALMGTLNPSTGQYTPPVPPNLFVAEDSILTRWMGNVFQRATKYIPYL